ncbi:MAG: 23S rRNA (adenine(2503)-C(2))-methyltransferase RlmN [Armatimonadota bacterium]|jgi:23S rRNA (adenine2503-C2)-methyltransferase
MELFGLDRAELSQICVQLGQSSFRGGQIAQWLYRKGAREIGAMTNLPAAMRERLANIATIYRSEVARESSSADGTTKYLLKLVDNETIESVLLPYPDRVSVCVSTQIGCPAGCVFCATAMCGFVRNLSAGEIVDQVITLQERGEQRVSHVVMMGMGEPLLNFDNVIKALHLLNDEVGIGMRRMTLSSVGIPSAIDRLRELNLQITLAISLHAPTDELRQSLIPVAKRYPLDELMRSCREYANQTKRRITFEYLLLAGINDSPEQGVELAKLLRHTLCNVNLIPFNEVEGLPYRRPSREAIKAFRQSLEENGVEVTQRMERGHSISAACGQLRRRHISS